ncbi:hypothetical protein Tdes44962_MAKER04317 [Teratosphaeria destructans]|uniref:Uncharacterized protein n=1 Tax=Teratosphaeria destructans TaxID=418781 RepID=A0A9W7SMK6_9PEZI|nr:hypothetical protein Tdes44962_MAKER04317 [Teratosphaeria destructans]
MVFQKVRIAEPAPVAALRAPAPASTSTMQRNKSVRRPTEIRTVNLHTTLDKLLQDLHITAGRHLPPTPLAKHRHTPSPLYSPVTTRKLGAHVLKAGKISFTLPDYEPKHTVHWADRLEDGEISPCCIKRGGREWHRGSVALAPPRSGWTGRRKPGFSLDVVQEPEPALLR